MLTGLSGPCSEVGWMDGGVGVSIQQWNGLFTRKGKAKEVQQGLKKTEKGNRRDDGWRLRVPFLCTGINGWYGALWYREPSWTHCICLTGAD